MAPTFWYCGFDFMAYYAHLCVRGYSYNGFGSLDDEVEDPNAVNCKFLCP